MRLDDEAVEAMQAVIDVVMPGAEVYMFKNDLAESVELGITVGIAVSATMSIEQVENYTDRNWGGVLSQLVASVRSASLQLSIANKWLTPEQMKKLGLDQDGEPRK